MGKSMADAVILCADDCICDYVRQWKYMAPNSLTSERLFLWLDLSYEGVNTCFHDCPMKHMMDGRKRKITLWLPLLQSKYKYRYKPQYFNQNKQNITSKKRPSPSETSEQIEALDKDSFDLSRKHARKSGEDVTISEHKTKCSTSKVTSTPDKPYSLEKQISSPKCHSIENKESKSPISSPNRIFFRRKRNNPPNVKRRNSV